MPRRCFIAFALVASNLVQPAFVVAQGAHADTPPTSPEPGSSDSENDSKRPDPANAPDASTNVYPPESIEPIVAEYPPEASLGRLEAFVVLTISINAEGLVTEAEVTETAGPAFDEAARSAALRARFRPARRGDVPIASRIRLRIEFQLPPEPTVKHSAQGPTGALPETTPAPPPAAPLHATPPPAAPPKEPVEIVVQGLSIAERHRQSAEAVTVIETEHAKRESADLGEVLARTQGVGVRRAGGLGSGTRFSLNGLTDDQVRFLLDGLPLEFSGYPFGVANVPVNLVERVEIYSGVVPVRFGADALGGVVNLVTNQALHDNRAAASYEIGSFETHRFTLSGKALHEPSGVFARVNGFFDSSQNNYSIDVEVPNERGRLSPARVRRFHDAYRATGVNAEAGVVGRPWAQRLLVRAFVTDYHNEYQHNVVMTVPYGGVTYGETSEGATLRYEQRLKPELSLNTAAGYSYTQGRFRDVATCVYDWFGRCARERRQPGETDSRPLDQRYWDHSGFARLNLGWDIHPEHALRLSVAPTYLTRTGDELLQSDSSTRDSLTAERDLLTVVNGAEYAINLFEDELENVAFVKQYLQFLDSEEPRPGDVFRRRDRDTHRFGMGNGLRYRLTPWLYTKASYEWATRLPNPEEVFGDNAFVVANLELEPETSHNVNLGVALDTGDTFAGKWRTSATGFLREADQLIVLLGNDRIQSYQNVFGARSHGVEGTVGWTAPNEIFVWDFNLTYLDFRNTSNQGTFGAFEGDRIPNRPYLFANYSARLQFRDVVEPRDEVAFTWNMRYVHDYFRGWESVGLREFKQTIPKQFVHNAGFGYFTQGERLRLSSTFEVQNLTDEAVFDFFGVQRPGRAFYLKMTAEL